MKLWGRFKLRSQLTLNFFKNLFVIWILRLKNRPKKILKYPNKILLRPSEPVKDFDKDLDKLIVKMFSTLMNQKWGGRLGIAASQIGVSKRVMIVLGKVMINPEWHPTKAPAELVLEGCYSLGQKIFKVPRAKYGWAGWRNPKGKWEEAKLKGTKAIVFQHELAHLEGKLCIENGEEVKGRVEVLRK